VNSNIRSALVGGLAATFVVAASLAPRLTSNDRAEVTVRQTSSDALPEESTSTSTTVETTTTTAAPTTTTTAALESRVTKVEQRVAVIEQTTTTTVPKPTTPTVEFYFEEPATRFGRDASQWVIVFRPTGPVGIRPGDFPNLRVRATVNTLNGPQDFIAEVTLSSDGHYVGNIIAFVDRALLDPAIAGEGSMCRPAPTYLEAATVEWDAGSQPALRCC
jgi:hypothetical protein